MKIRGDAPYLQHLLPCKFDYASFWSSPEKLARYIEERGQGNAWSDCAWSTSDPEWYGSKSMGDSISMARSGWPEGAARVSRIRDYVNASNPVRKEAVRYAMVGSTPSVPRAVAGDPKSMRAPQSIASKRRPIITLIHNMGAYSHVRSEAINNRSAVIAAVIDQIEAVGYCVEVIAISPVSGYGPVSQYPPVNSRKHWRMCTTVMVKPSDQPTDIGRLAFGLGQTSMFRRFAFGDRCLEETANRGLGGDMGSTIQLDPDPEASWKHTYLLPSNNVRSDLFDDEKIAATEGVQYVINELKKQRCPAFPGEAIPDPDEDEDDDPNWPTKVAALNAIMKR